MIDIITLDTALDTIAETAQTLLLAQVGVGLKLEGIATVVLSERSRPRPELPALYVWLDAATVGSGNMSLRESWRVPLTVVALVFGDEPEIAYKAAMGHAARARSVLLSDRKLGLAFVNDVVSSSFQPAYQTQVDNRTIYGAAATLSVGFTVYEG